MQDGQRDQPEDSDGVQTREEFTSPLWDAARAVEATTLSLMTGEKAAALSRAMGELTYVGREVYKEVNWQKLIIEMLSMDLWVKKGAGQQLTEEVLETSRTAAHHRDAQYGPVGQEGCRAAEEVLETSRTAAHHRDATVTTDVQREVVVLRCYSVSWTRSGGVFHG